MTFFGGSSTGGHPGATVFGRTPSRTDVLGRKYAPFSNPFFDQASTYTPPTVKSLFGFCRYYYLSHGLINAIITKAAEYPITDITLQHRSDGVRDKWHELLHGELNYPVHQFETNLDYFTYGNAFVSPSFPFRKRIICANCNAEVDALNYKSHWRYTNFRFWLTCPKCGQQDYAKSHDTYYAKHADIGLIRWNPENVTIFYNESTGRHDYAMDLSQQFRGQIMMGRKDLVATTPEIFLEAARTRRQLVFDKREIFHMRRPSLSSQERGWGIPMIMPVLKDAFYMQIMKKAQESILLTHMIPQIFLFPQPATGNADPFTTTNLQDWRAHIQKELSRQRLDPSYYGIIPFPLGHQIIGDNGRQLLLMPEIRQMAEMVSVGMGFPIDLVFGQGNYAGTSVSMRMLENFFLSNVRAQFRLLHWVMGRVGAFLNWPVPEARFKAFKMADDLQRQAFAFQLNQAGKISDTTLLSLADYNMEDESEMQMKETALRMKAAKKQQLAMAEIQGEAQTVMAKYQSRANQTLMEAQQSMAQEQMQYGGEQPDPTQSPFGQAQQSPATAQQPGVGVDQLVSSLASQLASMPPESRSQNLSLIAQNSPEIARMVEQRMQQNQQGGGSVDMRPMPEQKPPRRAGGV